MLIYHVLYNISGQIVCMYAGVKCASPAILLDQ